MEQEARGPARASLPYSRAFVVQVAEGAGGGAPLSGRVEHLASGCATHFASWAHLCEFVEGLIRHEAPTREE